MSIKQKRQMSIQLFPFIIISISISQNSPGADDKTTTLTKEKKSQKTKILYIFSTKKAIAKTKHFAVNNFVDDFANIMSLIFLQGAKDQADHKDCTLTCHYYLSLILCSFN